MQFEYKKRTEIKYLTDTEMDDLGLERWELVSVSVKDNWVTHIFKRQRVEVLEK